MEMTVTSVCNVQYMLCTFKYVCVTILLNFNNKKPKIHGHILLHCIPINKIWLKNIKEGVL